jgi:hypothetical protein
MADLVEYGLIHLFDLVVLLVDTKIAVNSSASFSSDTILDFGISPLSIINSSQKEDSSTSSSTIVIL